ncbi:hypothetical protein [Nocardia sp. CDC160]|uniref:hypothetical protein n=1 Tax=Nocardia sp. CDC160 TaxID=3112166 RepID=UPI002DB90FFE|nr:hypothetical protein [Nocardia sp. CDC160]MEC3915490.1 hypothetical protein [Nocardia sp. CDC160]
MQFSIRILTAATALITVPALSCAVAQADPTTDEVSFASPSGNIECLVTPTLAGCEISAHDYANPPGRDCPHSAYGDRLIMDSTGVQFPCHNDRLVGTTPGVLDYGHRVTVGGYTCLSTVDYVECSGGGHRFRLSRQSYSID